MPITRKHFLGCDGRCRVARGAAACLCAEQLHAARPPDAAAAGDHSGASAIEPWAEKVEKESGGRLKFELYPTMQLGGAPPDLFDQAKDGVVDLVWTVLGYTPGRFPKSEVFELPFMLRPGRAGSVAFQEYRRANAMDEFTDVKLIGVHAHGPGLFHSQHAGDQARGPEGHEDPRRLAHHQHHAEPLGAEPIGMPVPQVAEALSTGRHLRHDHSLGGDAVAEVAELVEEPHRLSRATTASTRRPSPSP